MAIGIGAIVFITLYAGLAQGFSFVERARHRLRATQILTEKLEVIRLYSWAQVNTTGFIPTKFTEYYSAATNGHPGIAYSGDVTVTNAAVQPAYNSTMRKAIAHITWVTGGITNQATMETLISQYGIQNYFY